MGSVVRGVVLGGGLLPLEAAVKVEGVEPREGRVARGASLYRLTVRHLGEAN